MAGNVSYENLSDSLKQRIEELNVEIVNDLTTGGADKALSAEQGKELKLEADIKFAEADKKIEDIKASISMYNVHRQDNIGKGVYTTVVYQDPNNISNKLTTTLSKSNVSLKHFDRVTWQGEINGESIDYLFSLEYNSTETEVIKVSKLN